MKYMPLLVIMVSGPKVVAHKAVQRQKQAYYQVKKKKKKKATYPLLVGRGHMTVVAPKRQTWLFPQWIMIMEVGWYVDLFFYVCHATGLLGNICVRMKGEGGSLHQPTSSTSVIVGRIPFTAKTTLSELRLMIRSKSLNHPVGRDFTFLFPDGKSIPEREEELLKALAFGGQITIQSQSGRILSRSQLRGKTIAIGLVLPSLWCVCCCKTPSI